MSVIMKGTTMITYNLNGEFKRYVLQRINHTIFTNLEALMDNMIKGTFSIYQDKKNDIYFKYIKIKIWYNNTVQ